MAISNSYVKLPKGKALREHQFLFWLPNFDGFSGVDVSCFFPHMGLNHDFLYQQIGAGYFIVFFFPGGFDEKHDWFAILENVFYFFQLIPDG